jgi:hypothetical protein
MITTDCFVAVADVAMMTNPYRLVIVLGDNTRRPTRRALGRVR